MKNIFVLLSLLPTILLAQTIEVREAENKALQFLQTKKQTRASQQEVQLSLAYTSQAGDETYYYVFNNDAGGFVIMGGDEAAKEVLGYSDKGTFDYAHIPDNMRWWLSQYDAEISHAIGEVKAGRTSVMKYAKTRSSRPDIPAMLTTEWGQDEPYNCQLPTYAAGYTGDNALVTGCAVTAAAQVMKYYEWPDTGVGSATKKYNDLTFEADFEHTYYDWAHMADTYTSGTYTGTAEEVAVGTLMYHLGVATEANYNTGPYGGTTTGLHNLISRLADVFKYNKGMTFEYRENFSDSEWEQLIYNELSEGRPVLYSGSANFNSHTIGHEFVCDGYEDGRWHINWGWDGLCNTTFLLTASATEEVLRPAGTGTGGADDGASYVLHQNAIIGLYPDKDGTSEYRRDPLVVTSFKMSSFTAYQRGEKAKSTIYVEKHDKSGYAMQVKYKFVNIDDDEEVLITPEIYTVTVLPGESCYIPITLTIPAKVKPGATYQVIPMMEDEQGEWRPIPFKQGVSYPNLDIQPWSGIGPDSFTIINDGYASSDGPIGSAAVRNYALETLTQPLVIWVYPEEGGDSIDYFDLGEVTLEGDGLDWMHFTYQDLHSQTLPGQPQTLVPGQNYLVRMQNLATGDFISKLTPLYFRKSQTIEYTIPESGWGTICLPFQSDGLPEDLKAYYNAYSFDNDKLSLLDNPYIICNYPMILHGTPGTTYRFSGPIVPVGLQTDECLTASTEGDIYAPKGSYVLQCRDGITGFYKVHEDNQVLVKQYEAYLVPDVECGDFISLGEYYESPTVIEDIYMRTDDCYTQTYNLLGIEVSDDYRGIVISKGKKYIRK